MIIADAKSIVLLLGRLSSVAAAAAAAAGPLTGYNNGSGRALLEWFLSTAPPSGGGPLCQ